MKPEDVLSYLDHPMILKTAIVVANKLDAPGAETRLHLLRRSCPSLTVVPVSMAKAVGLKELPRQLYDSLGIIRIYTKRTGLAPSIRPMIVKAGSSVGEIARIIHNDLFLGFKFAKIWGSSWYGGERVGLGFVPRDRDVIEIHA